jgi:glucan 1,3-beta-glucosidase
VTDCAYKSYSPSGVRYDGTVAGFSYVGSCAPYTVPGSQYSADYKVFLRKFFEAQTSSE